VVGAQNVQLNINSSAPASLPCSAEFILRVRIYFAELVTANQNGRLFLLPSDEHKDVES
jgi:hypothetical protein